jgi:hypothetical protein
MQHLEVSCAVHHIYMSLVGSGLIDVSYFCCCSTVHFDKYQSFYDQQINTLLTQKC